jgi:uncharacterized protein with GYD domain
MLWAAYGRITQEGVKGMITNPQNRAEAVRKLVDALGGKMLSYHMLMNGDIDFFIIVDMPEDKSANIALINPMLVRGTGGVESIVTVPCVLAEDAKSLMEKGQELAAAMAYKPPSQ